MIPKLHLTKYRTDDGKRWACAWVSWLGRIWMVERKAIG